MTQAPSSYRTTSAARLKRTTRKKSATLELPSNGDNFSKGSASLISSSPMVINVERVPAGDTRPVSKTGSRVFFQPSNPNQRDKESKYTPVGNNNRYQHSDANSSTLVLNNTKEPYEGKKHIQDDRHQRPQLISSSKPVNMGATMVDNKDGKSVSVQQQNHSVKLDRQAVRAVQQANNFDSTYARVAAVAGLDGLAHFEKDDYERFVEDRQRAILFGTLPNKLEDATENVTFNAFISKLKQVEFLQKQKRHGSSVSNNHSPAHNSTPTHLQKNLEALDDDNADFIMGLEKMNLTMHEGRQVGGQNHQFRRVSRPQTRTSNGQSSSGLQPQKPTLNKQNGMILANGATMITGQSLGTSSMTPHPPAHGRDSRLRRQPGQSRKSNQGTSYYPSGTGSTTSQYLFAFPPPSNVIYNISRPAQNSKLSLPVLSNGAAQQQLKIVNVNFPQKLKIDNLSTFSATPQNH